MVNCDSPGNSEEWEESKMETQEDVVATCMDGNKLVDGWTDAHQACFEGDDTLLDKLISLEPDTVKAETAGGHTLLHVAVAENKLDVMHVLLEKGALLNKAASLTGSTPAHMAVRTRNLDALVLLVQAGANLGLSDIKGETPVALAARKQHWDMVDACLKHASKRVASFINKRNQDGVSILHEAACSGSVSILTSLLQQGADVAVVDKLGNTPIHAAAQHGKEKCVRELATHGCPVDIAKMGNGYSALHDAVCFGHLKVIDALLSLGSKVEERTSSMASALHIAAEMNHVACIHLLVERGCDLEAEDMEGWRPLHVAAYHGQVEAVKALLAHGAKPAMDAKQRKKGVFGFMAAPKTPEVLAAQCKAINPAASSAIVQLLKDAAAGSVPAKPAQSLTEIAMTPIRNDASGDSTNTSSKIAAGDQAPTPQASSMLLGSPPTMAM